jgi:8-oxo-dGTP diphosphatase
MKNFSIRVYGILINDQKQILVSDELIRGMRITKFPGGGLELGEGTRECLAREFMEELNLKVAVGEHIYTTDYFQVSAFNTDYQILSIYYAVKALEELKGRLGNSPFDFDDAQMIQYEETKAIENPRFINWHDFDEDALTLPIDKIVAKMIKKG